MLLSKLFILIINILLKTSWQIQLPIEDSCECGVRNDAAATVRVIGGTEAVTNEFPWAALLRIGRNGQNQFQCGGSLINDRFVLTAAHCLPKPQRSHVQVVLGAHNISSSSESNALTLRAVSVSVHEQFYLNLNEASADNDVALVELNEPVNFSLYPHIRPICMPEPKFVESNDDLLTAVGWGLTKVHYIDRGNLIEGRGISNTFSDTLQKIDVRAVELQTCQQTFSGINVEIKDIHMCAKSNSGDTCQGDSGGGLVKEHITRRFYEIVGVVSFGVGCNSKLNGKPLPGVYARVTSVFNWIESKISSGRLCRRPLPSTTAKPTRPCSEWGEWTPFSECTHTSGYGKKTRTKVRTGICRRGKTFTQEIFCKQIEKTTAPTITNRLACSEWGEWTSYSNCRPSTNTYGSGKKERTKFRKGSSCRGTQFTQEKSCIL